MTIEARMAKAKKIVDTISRDVWQAIALQKLYKRCAAQRDIIESVNAYRDVPLGFNVIRGSIHFELHA